MAKAQAGKQDGGVRVWLRKAAKKRSLASAEKANSSTIYVDGASDTHATAHGNHFQYSVSEPPHASAD